jgi:Xaa-Pro aminopeptidase
MTAFPPARFQTFDIRSDRKSVAPRVKALRARMREAGIDAFLIPRADAHRGESVPPGEARLAYVTGFTGSAGLAVVGARKAALFVDSRYTLQAPAQTDTKCFAVIEVAQASTPARIVDFVPQGGVLGYDPWLHTPGEIRDLTQKLGGHASLRPVANPVDAIWPDRPPAPATPIEFLGHNRAGREASDKVAAVQRDLAEAGLDATVLTLPDSICWLFNIRGRDVPNTPFVLAFAIVPRRGLPTLFLEREHLTPDTRKRFAGLARLADKATLIAALRRLGAADRKVGIDPASCPVAVVGAITGPSEGVVVERPDPVRLPKAKKNEAEIAGMREAHRLDGIAMARFLCWFDAEAPRGTLSEIDIVTALEAFRREEDSAIDNSFDTIAGTGPNGAIVHYRVDSRSNRKLGPGELTLVDSGAQYLAGTTDITRTLSNGPVPDIVRDRYTRVLKGMIAVSVARFPRGTGGGQIDILARQFLWQEAITYNHGTGHGVGAFLSVHEGPVGIAARFSTPFEPGMIVSNEPGYYEAGAYGIRIENLILVRQSPMAEGWLEFETLTLSPIDTRLIALSLLTGAERDWLNAYHARVRAEIGPHLDGTVRAWLEKATAPI